MAEALLKGLLRAGYACERIAVSEPNAGRRAELERLYSVSTTSENIKSAHFGQIIILAVKPAVIPDVCREIASVASGRLIVSIAAGVKSAAILDALGGDARVVRVMPNTPALVGDGMSALSSAGSASDADLESAGAIFATVGKTVVVKEDLLDAVTGLSGSGPAYAFLMIEALSDGGVLAGLSRADARLLAAQTLLGSARMAIETGLHPGALKDMVTSPGGTTIHALRVLENAGVRGALIDAVAAAVARAKELGGVPHPSPLLKERERTVIESGRKK